MDEKDFEMLSDLAKTCNITKSAQRLYTTQSALTKRIKKLEDELSVQLFFRTKKGLLMTPVLEEILPHLNTITDSIEKIRNLASSTEGEIAGTLTLGISSNYARYRLPEVLEEYMARYPKVEIHINSHRSPALYRSLLENSISVAIIRGEYPWGDGDIILSEEPICLVVSKLHESTPLDQLPYIARETDAGYISDLSRWRNENGLQPSRSDLIISDVPTVITMVERGMGWSVLPAICLDHFSGVVRPLRFKNGKAFTRKTHILYRMGHFELPQVRAFIEIAQRHEAKYHSTAFLGTE